MHRPCFSSFKNPMYVDWRASIKTNQQLNELSRRDFCNGAKLRPADLESAASYIG